MPAMMLSCLSSHAALAVFDGLERTTLPAKCTGVFAQEIDPNHPLAARFHSPVLLPHSRLNTVPVEAMHDAGYEVLLQSKEVGWSVATKTVGRSERRAGAVPPGVRPVQPGARICPGPTALR